MTQVCLDTSAYSRFRLGHAACVEIIDAARSVFVPAIVLGELRAGFRRGQRHRENESALQRFLASPVVEILDVDDEVAAIYGDLWAELRAAGTPIPTNDLWIAATAVRRGATLLTLDRHFTLVQRVGVFLLDDE